MLQKYWCDIKALSAKHINNTHIQKAIDIINKKLPISNKEKTKLLEHSISTLIIEINNVNYTTSFGLMRFIFFASFENVFNTVKTLGLFRASKYQYKVKLLKELLGDISSRRVLSDEDSNYLRNINGILALSPEIYSIKTKVIAFIKSRPYFFKTALALAELKFNEITYSPFQKDNDVLDQIYFNNKESILESVSYALTVYREVKKSNSENTDHIDENINKSVYYDIFYYCFQIQQYNESEIKVDFFGHDVIFDKKNEIFGIFNPEFETAKSYGYTKTDLRFYSQLSDLAINDNIVSYHNHLQDLWSADSKEEKSHLYFIVQEPVERIILPTLFFEYADERNLFSNDYLFKEERAMLLILCNENYNDKVLSVKIYKDFTAFDIIKLQRAFTYISFIYKNSCDKLRKDGNHNSEIIKIRSLLPTFNSYQLCSIFHSICGHSVEQCNSFINKLSTRLCNNNSPLDLQYNPIIKIDDSDEYLIMPTVLGFSNIIRSLCISEKIHLSIDGTHDHMVHTVTKALLNKKFKVFPEFKFGKDEIDIVALLDDHLFLFECKNPYHPVNDYELRNTYAHLKKGSIQIRKFKNFFTEQQRKSHFFQKLKIQKNEVKHIHYGIINANRVLSGFHFDDIKIFHANELANFLNTGKIKTSHFNFHCWESHQFSVQDLINFMEGKVITSDFKENTIETIFGYRFRRFGMYFINYSFDMKKINDLSTNKYKKEYPL